MNKIIKYMPNGKLENEYELTYDNLRKCNGMMSKVYLKTGIANEMYLNAFDDDEVIVNLWLIIDNNILKENINFNEIKKIESILYSHPRWGHKSYIKFEFVKVKDGRNNDDFF